MLSSDNVTPDSQAAVIVVQAEQPSVHVSEAVLNISVPCTPPVNRGKCLPWVSCHFKGTNDHSYSLKLMERNDYCHFLNTMNVH